MLMCYVQIGPVTKDYMLCFSQYNIPYTCIFLRYIVFMNFVKNSAFMKLLHVRTYVAHILESIIKYGST